jgi:hypothetical protein
MISTRPDTCLQNRDRSQSDACLFRSGPTKFRMCCVLKCHSGSNTHSRRHVCIQMDKDPDERSTQTQQAATDLVCLQQLFEVAVKSRMVFCGGRNAGGGLVLDVGDLRPQQRDGTSYLDKGGGGDISLLVFQHHYLFTLHKVGNSPL